LTDVLDLESAIRKTAPAFAKAIKKAAASSHNEAEFRTKAWKFIDDFSTEHDLDLQSRDEYRLFNGRADAVYNRFVIEYEAPGRLRENPTLKGNTHAVQQVKDYLEGVKRRERHKPERLAGVAFDGHWFIFVMRREKRWQAEDPVPVDASSCERFLSLLASLSLERAVQPEYLIKDFGETTRVARLVVSTLYKTLSDTDVPFVKVMFEQWSMQFKEVCDYTKASKLDLDTEAAKFAVKGKNIDPFKFFFCLHTYYATFIKFLAVQIVQFYLMPKLGTNLRQVVSTNDAKLRGYMEDLERGGLMKKFGINNFLEGDFFKWYVEAWDDSIAAAMREMIKTLANYSLVTLDADPNVTRDILKVLYQGLVPKKLRHNLGEYYTPDWLAERLINVTVVGDLKPTDKVLDPACGSGTFLVLCIRKMRDYARKKMLPESEVLDRILASVVGFDLNPLAVISARTNYLLALGDLLEHRKGDISIPVYLCDSVVHPHEVADVSQTRLRHIPVKTAVGSFLLPPSVIKRATIRRMAEELEEIVELDVPHGDFVARIGPVLELDPAKEADDIELLWQLYQRLLELKRNKVNGVWARVIKNAFAPLFLKNFDYVVGNPPWVNWESLPEKYRVDDVVPLFQEKYGLFPHKGLRARHGSAKIDISALMAYVVADISLKRNGRLGFLITQSVFKTDAGKGFRKFALPDDTPLGIVHVDDITAFQPFEGAANRTAAFVLQKGKKTQYGRFTYWAWLKRKGRRGSLPTDSTWVEIEDRVDFNRFTAEPVDKSDATSQWLTGRPLALKAVRKVLGSSDYKAHEGINPGGAGASGIYWVDIVGSRPGGTVVVANMAHRARIDIESVQAPVESELVYPHLWAGDVRRWYATSSGWIVAPQSSADRKHATPLATMKARYPKALMYLGRFKDLLSNRSAYLKYLPDEPYYALYDVKDYTFSKWKVVWPNIASRLMAAVVSGEAGKVVLPQHIVTLVACTRRAEAHFLCALVNSSLANFAASAYSQKGGKSFGDPHILEHICVPKFDPKDKTHLALAELSMQAHKATAKGDTKRVAKIEEQIDLLAAKLWGLTDKELKEIKLALEELR